MEGFSIALGVVPLAVQLADTVKKLCEFWNSVKEAPKEIETATNYLKLLQSILCSIADEAQYTKPDTILTHALEDCHKKVDSLVSTLEDIEPGFASTKARTRKWTAVKTAFMDTKLKKFQDIVESLKSTILLAQQIHSS